MKHWEAHPTYVEGCFGCKGMSLQMNSGDAKRDIPDKKWNAELQAYRDARDQGMRPAGTTMRDVQQAHEASGDVYDLIMYRQGGNYIEAIKFAESISLAGSRPVRKTSASSRGISFNPSSLGRRGQKF